MEGPGFFVDQKGDFFSSKVNFLENTLCYANQGTISTVTDYLILGQLMLVKNSLENIDEYERKRKKVKIYVPLFDTNDGNFGGLDTRLAFIMV